MATARTGGGPMSRAGAGGIARRCERAVVTAYRDLRGLGVADPDAFRGCATLYRIHHVVRGDRGPTPGCECD